MKTNIEKSLAKGSLPAHILQSKFKIGFHKSIYDDPNYMPFYYYLGQCLKGVKTLIKFGFDLGLPSGCFLQGCGEVECFLAFRKKNDQFYHRRLGVSNIHNILRKKFNLWEGGETDPEFVKGVLLRKWDCAIISDAGQKESVYRAYLDLAWNQLSDDGLLVLDYLSDSPVRSAYEHFKKIHHFDSISINTVRGTEILKK